MILKRANQLERDLELIDDSNKDNLLDMNKDFNNSKADEDCQTIL